MASMPSCPWICVAQLHEAAFSDRNYLCGKDKEDMIADIVQSDFSVGEKTLRLLSLDAEKRNREICDFVIDNRDEQGSERILQLLNF